jgi:hypothetical protein
MTAVMKGQLFPMIVRQVIVAALIGVGYWWKVRKLPIERVNPLWFVPIAFVLPVIYALMTPLALFTLDSGSWETRHHHDDGEPEPEPRGTRDDDDAATDAIPARPMLDPVTVTSSALPVASTAAAASAAAASATSPAHAERPAA